MYTELLANILTKYNLFAQNSFLAQSFFRDILPSGLQGFLGNSNTPDSNTEALTSLLGTGLILLFVGIVLVAIVYAALAGFKYIRSQGAADKVEEAQEAIKSVMIGLVVAFLGVVMVVIIAGVFGSGSGATRAIQCVIDRGFLKTRLGTDAAVNKYCDPDFTGSNVT